MFVGNLLTMCHNNNFQYILKEYAEIFQGKQYGFKGFSKFKKYEEYFLQYSSNFSEKLDAIPH